jgi:hypothetical protein
MYWNKYYKTWSHPFWSAGIADVMAGLFLAGVAVWMAEQCIKKRIRWPAFSAMAVAIYAAYGLVSMGQGGGYEGWNGIPFTWYRWTDIGDGYKMYSALYADIALAIVSVGVLVLLAEWHHRLENKAVSASILIVVAGLSAILLLWRTSIHYSGNVVPIEFLGTPFHWGSPNDYGPWYQIGSWPAFLGNVAVAFACVTLLSFMMHSIVRGFVPQSPSYQIAAKKL